jgi:dienelactone hydrolase
MIRTCLAASLAWLLGACSVQGAPQAVDFPSTDTALTRGQPTQLHGLLYRPAHNDPAPAVVLMHGCGGFYGRNGRDPVARNAEWAQKLRDLGYVTLLVDSFSPRGVHDVCRDRPQPITGARERPYDAYGALQFLQSQPFVRADRIALMGWSHGGSTTLWTIADSAPARPALLPKGDFAAAVAFYPGCLAMASSRHWSTHIATLVLQGAADDWAPAAPCEAAEARARKAGLPVQLVVYPDANHGFDAPNQSVHVLTGIPSTHSGTATVGTNPAARSDVYVRVPDFLAQHLSGKVPTHQ